MSNSPTTKTERRARPRAFRLEGDETVPSKPASASGAELIESETDAFAREAAELVDGLTGDEAAVEAAQANGLLQNFVMSWGGVFVSAITGLFSLALSIWAWNFVADLFSHSAILGAIGLFLAGAAALAAGVFILREIRSILRQNQIARLHVALAEAHAANNQKAARARCRTDAPLRGAPRKRARPRLDEGLQ